MTRQKSLWILPVLLWALFAPIPVCAAGRKMTHKAYLKNLRNQGKERVIVLFDNETDSALIAGYNAKLIRKFRTFKGIVCEIDKDKIDLLKHHTNVKAVIPDMLIKAPSPVKASTHPIKQQQEENLITPLSYDGPVTVRWNNLQAGLNAQAAWDNYDVNGTEIKIAFVDTGVNYNLPDLNDNYLGGYDYVSDDNDPINDASYEVHGTKIASLAAAEGESQIVGVAHNAGYYVVRVLDSAGSGYVSDAIKAIEWAMDPDGNPNTDDNADIISMSLGTYGGTPGWQTIKTQWENTCNNAYDAGIVLVAGSGNDGLSYSMYPAAFDNVICVGAHNESQNIWSSSNGGVDVVAPGQSVLALKPNNSTESSTGTSAAAPHVSALIAIQSHYANLNNIELNNGYLWEVIMHSAVDLGASQTYQGEGKIYAAQTDTNDPNVGSIDLIASNWPIDYDFQFHDYAFIDANIPVYQIGSDVNQSIILTNITDTLGNYTEDIEDLNVTATQVYYGQPNEPNLPGSPTEVFSTIALLEPGEANSITLSLTYTIPPETLPGLKTTKLDFEFNFTGNNRTLKASYNQPDLLWYAAIPGDIVLNDNVDMIDFTTFARQWRQTNCNLPDWCGRADMNQKGDVNWVDLDILAENWLSGVE